MTQADDIMLTIVLCSLVLSVAAIVCASILADAIKGGGKYRE